MEPQSSLPYWQEPAACPYPEPTVPTTPSHFLKIHLNIISHLRLGLPNGLFPSGFPTKTLSTPLPSFICGTCPAHLNLLDFITHTILGEEYRPLSSSLCNFPHSPVTPSLLGPNIHLNTLFSNTPFFRKVLTMRNAILPFAGVLNNETSANVEGVLCSTWQASLCSDHVAAHITEYAAPTRCQQIRKRTCYCSPQPYLTRYEKTSRTATMDGSCKTKFVQARQPGPHAIPFCVTGSPSLDEKRTHREEHCASFEEVPTCTTV